MCILHIQCISALTSHISKCSVATVASDCHKGYYNSTWMQEGTELASRPKCDRGTVRNKPFLLFSSGIYVDVVNSYRITWSIQTDTHILIHLIISLWTNMKLFPNFSLYKNVLINILMCISCAHMQAFLWGQLHKNKVICELFKF